MSDLLSRDMASVVESIARPGTLIVLDFDGTLAAVVGDRDAAGLTRRSRGILERLARLFPVAVLSGRAAKDVRSRLEGVALRWVVGSHGAEWPGEEREHRAWRTLVATWRATLTSRLGGVDGVELEAKPLSLAVHYRHSRHPREAVARIGEAIRDLPGSAIVPGKKVVNLVPAGAGDKGTALRRLVELAGAARVLFVGDDVTDEAAFGAHLDVPSVMVRVGWNPSSLAQSWLRRRSDVDVLLERLCEAREVAGPGPRRKTVAEPTPGAELEALGSVLGFMKELWALEQGLNKRSKAMLDRRGVTGPQRLVVRMVGRLGPISPARLARVLHLHPSSVTRLVRKLEARGLIRRTPHPTYRGRLLIELGPRGGRVEQPGAGTVESAVKAALSSARAEDVTAARRVIAMITKRLVGRR
jgi:trehalose 6-phosphate phosphatase